MKRVAVLASGGGSNVQAIIDHLASLGERSAAQVVMVASDRPQAGALVKARAANITAVVLKNFAADSTEILDRFAAEDIDLVALAGYLRLIPPPVVDAFAGRMINVHPALLPKHGGAGMYGLRVHQAVLRAGEKSSGPTVHLVTHEFDSGPVLAQWRVGVLADDDAHALAARVLVAEHALYPRVLQALAANETARFPMRPPEDYVPPITPEEIRRDIIAAFSPLDRSA
jgi:formyltetrahydrofolate-dependent phosphoribosylglycinamide formyltransferase